MNQKEIRKTVAEIEQIVDDMRNKRGKSYNNLIRNKLHVEFVINEYENILSDLKSQIK
jgi:hypothetical protein